MKLFTHSIFEMNKKKINHYNPVLVFLILCVIIFQNKYMNLVDVFFRANHSQLFDLYYKFSMKHNIFLHVFSKNKKSLIPFVDLCVAI